MLCRNGATYTAMINTSSKLVAAATGVLSFLSYATTGVVAAVSAVDYIKTHWHAVNIMGASLIIVLIFGVLCLLGLRDSAYASLFFCIFHVVSMVLLVVHQRMWDVFDCMCVSVCLSTDLLVND